MNNAYTFDSLRALIASNDDINGANLVEALPALIAERDAMLKALSAIIDCDLSTVRSDYNGKLLNAIADAHDLVAQIEDSQT